MSGIAVILAVCACLCYYCDINICDLCRETEDEKRRREDRAIAEAVEPITTVDPRALPYGSEYDKDLN